MQEIIENFILSVIALGVVLTAFRPPVKELEKIRKGRFKG